MHFDRYKFVIRQYIFVKNTRQSTCTLSRLFFVDKSVEIRDRVFLTKSPKSVLNPFETAFLRAFGLYIVAGQTRVPQARSTCPAGLSSPRSWTTTWRTWVVGRTASDNDCDR